MKETRKIGKRLLSAALAAALAVTTMGTQVFASPEEGGTDSAAEVSSRVLSWSWPEGTDATWDEETQTWTLACSYTTEQPLTQETLTQLLPAQITAVVQTEVATSETAEEDTVTEDTVEDTAAEEESGEPASDAAVSEGPTAADSFATPDTASAGDRTPMKKTAPEDNAENDTDTAATESQTIAENLTLTWDFSGLTFPLQTGEYTLTASLPEAYQLEEGTPAVQLELQVYPPVATTSNDIQTRADVVQNVISPSNVTIDLFDYHADGTNENNKQDPAGDINTGANGDERQFQVGTGSSGGADGYSINKWTGRHDGNYQNEENRPAKGGPYTDIVEPVLSDGFPTLQKGKPYDATWDGSRYDYSYTTGSQSLAYLFDTTTVGGKAGYYGVTGLLQLNTNTGVMSYDSQQNFAEFRSDGNGSGSFTLYDQSAVNADGNSADQQSGQFFPFNTYDEALNYTSSLPNLDHYFGMHMKAYFMQPQDGKLSNNDAMTFNFSGDDDVWVFIDGVLIGDVGGMHDRLELSINFATGEVTVQSGAKYGNQYCDTPYTQTTIKDMVEKAKAWAQKNGKTVPSIELEGNTLASNTYHTLDFFYMERGGGNSNLKLETNLVEIPVSSVIKVDQLGNPIPGVTFSLYKADENYNVEGEAIATGTTNDSGTLVLEDENKQPIAFAELTQNNQEYFVLRESGTPDGYRSTGDIHLHYQKLGEHEQGVLLSDNSWQSGSWAATTMQATIQPGSIDSASSGGNVSVEKNLANRLFAVILKRKIPEGEPSHPPTAEDDWYAISGDVLSGWTLSDKPIENAAKIDPAARHYFTWDATTQKYTLTFNSLPGDITKYYYMLGEGDKANTVYTIGYYYINDDNTITRLDSDSSMIGRQYAINAYVTNVKNYLFVQKVDESGQVVPSGATFALYDAERFSLNPTYEKLKNGTAVDTVTTRDQTSPSSGVNGVGYFPSDSNRVLRNGAYYLIETEAPSGYAINKQVIKVIVDENGVYADAGGSSDGVSTLVGVGSLVDSMAQFGSSTSEDGLDRTLGDIIAYKATHNVVTWKENDKSVTWNNPDENEPLYLSCNEGATLEYGPTADNGKYYFESDTGWTAIGSIKQNYNTSVGDIEVTTTNKTNLKEAPYNNPDVKDLFSRTTVVRVADTRLRLTITKQVEGVELNPTDVSEQTYTFQVYKLQEDSSTQTDMSYNQQVAIASGDSESETQASFTKGVLQVTVTGATSVTIKGLAGNAQYRVEEINTSKIPAVATQNGVVNEWESVSYTVAPASSSVSSEENTITVTDNPDDNPTVTATNHYVAYKYLTVTKTVDGNMGDKTKGFSFTLGVKDAMDTTYTGTLQYRTGTKDSPIADSETFKDLSVNTQSNKYTFTLKDNDKIEIKIPYGYAVTVTEPAVNGYTTSSRQYASTTEEDQKPNLTTVSEQTITKMNTDNTVDFVNECTIQVPTGLHGETRPYAAMVGLAGAAALLSIAGWVELRRRKRREQE
ncbi:SpaA isopeptide-forming pilin-related protein [uncultured Subdoligranulum sp.]|uniref:DUF7601 domain-containing protein n=1 Tax=uncultured Subdoligranulum sp. TaxID=512298 RepID=UPI0025D49B41|nr:SpaA isopeptide-forming pilin-related protein [uncultured Subdoligranulum sp.]